MFLQNRSARRARKRMKGVAAVAAAVLTFAVPGYSAFADSPQSLSPGQTVTLYTFTWSSAANANFSVSFDSTGPNADNFPSVSGSQLTVHSTPLPDGGYSDQVQFTMPNLGVDSQPMVALISTGDGAVATRFKPVEPPITSSYGLSFQYDSTPVNNLPEAPLAGALPLELLGVAGTAGAVWLYRSRQTKAVR